MIIEVLTIQHKRRINNDCMGSFGLGFQVGHDLLAKSIGFVKAKGVKIPDLQAVYVASILKQQGHQVKISNHPGPADAYWIHTSLNGFRQEIKIAKQLKNVTFFGAMAGAMPQHYLPYGKVVPHPESTFFDCIDDYPFPEWDLFNYRSFRYYPSLKRRPVVPMLSSRGCKHSCHYCPYATHYGAWTPRSINNVLAEIVANVERFGVKGIIFRDPLFTADKRHTHELLKGICALPFRIDFACETRIEYVDAVLLREMRKAGCRAVHFGIESADKQVLQSIGRHNPPFVYQKKILDFCASLGIRTNCFFVLGFPTDTIDTIRQTVDHACRLNPNVAEFFIATPYPGTEFSKTVELSMDYTDMTGYNLAYKHPVFSPEQLSSIKDLAYRQFYFRFAWIWKFITML